ncbi:MAG: hypothetical protein LC700_01395 [Actinobacteria bacterium]|nr:hypothetical protein [Actinomycetota bacterium]
MSNATTNANSEYEDDGERLDADLDEPTTATRHRGVFGENYSALRQLGWTGVLRLPPGEKKPPLGARSKPLYRSMTGYSGVDCDLSELHTIATTTMWDVGRQPRRERKHRGPRPTWRRRGRRHLRPDVPRRRRLHQR